MPLKNIPPLLSPAFLHALASLGHGDCIVLADAHFPASSIACSPPFSSAVLIDCCGHGIPEILKAVLSLLPLDEYDSCAAVMKKVDRDELLVPTPVWDEFRSLIREAEGRPIELEQVERFEFYERAKKAQVIVRTGEMAKYGNLILKTGVWTGSNCNSNNATTKSSSATASSSSASSSAK